MLLIRLFKNNKRKQEVSIINAYYYVKGIIEKRFNNVHYDSIFIVVTFGINIT